MFLWEVPENCRKFGWFEKDWRTLRRVRDQLAYIQLQLAEKAQTSQAAQAIRSKRR